MSDSLPNEIRRKTSPSPWAPRGEWIAWFALALSVTTLVLVALRPMPSSSGASPPNSQIAAAALPNAAPTGADDWGAALARERAARLELEASLRDVEAQLAAALDAGAVATAAAPTAAATAGRPVDRAPQRGLDEEVLIAAGFNPADARELKRAYDELQMDQLYALDRAARDGGDDRESWSTALEEMAAREQALADQYGEAAYDWMLYASGRPNQVAVERVFSGSPAEAAGLTKGDVVVRYAGESVRNGQELREATSAGTAGEWVEVEVLRDGERELVQLPRGPLGITVDVDSVVPNSG